MSPPRARTVALLGALALSACLPRGAAAPQPPPAHPEILRDVRTAAGRPPVVLVAREGDPATAVGIAVTTTGIGWNDAPAEDPEPASALAGLVESRLRARGYDVRVTPSWDGLRASALFSDAAAASRFADAVQATLAAPATDADLAPAQRKLAALAQRPLRDRALARWAQCVGEPQVLPERAGKDHAYLALARLERWRASSFGLGRVAFAVTAPLADAERIASTVLRGRKWSAAAPLAASASSSSAGETAVDLFEVPQPGIGAVLHATLDVGTSSAAAIAAEALGDPRGPLAARLSELDLPFRVREVTGTAHPRGGCVGVVLEAAPSSQSAQTGADLAARVADALALVRLEASVFLAEGGTGKGLATRRSGDAREAAERAAWWALADRAPSRTAESSLVLAVPSRRGAKDAAAEPTREALAAAVARAEAAWKRPLVESRSRVESGQAELWVLVGSPCGVDDEPDSDAGLTSLFVSAAAEAAKASPDVRVEPWVATDGAGLLVHGPALPGEPPTAHARRLADVGARSFAAEPLSAPALARARADLLGLDARNDGAAMAVLANALAPQHPSWLVPWGSGEPLARSSDAAVRARAQSLRAGPIRVAVLANGGAAQAEAAVRAADRWVARRGGDARACRSGPSAEPPRPGTYASVPPPGAVPEAYLAFPFTAGDVGARRAAELVASALGGDGGLLDQALLGREALAREASARVLGWPRAPALVVRIVAPQASLDGAVMQTRGLLHRVHEAGLPDDALARAAAAQARASLATMLDPRARVVATWRGEPVAVSASGVAAGEVASFAAKHLGEESMVVVAVRPPRPATSP